MRNKKLIALLALLIVLVIACSLVLSACVDNTGGGDDDGDGDDDGGVDNTGGGDDDGGGDIGGGDDEGDLPPPPLPETKPKPVKKSALEVLKMMVGGIDNSAEDEKRLYLEFIGLVTLTEQPDDMPEVKTDYELSLRTNMLGILAEENASVSKNEFALVLKQVDTSTIKFAFYIIEEKAYLQVEGSNALIYLSDFNMNYLAQIIGKVPGLIGGLNLDELLANFGGVDGILSLVLGMLCDNVKYEPVTENGVVTTKLSVDFVINSFMNSIKGVLGGIDIGGLLGINLDIKALIDAIAAMIPNMKITLSATLVDGILAEDDGIKLDVTNNDNNTNFVLKTRFDIGETAPNIDLPIIEEFREFSLTNIAFDIDLIIDSGLEDGGAPKQVDVGQLINMFTGKETLPVGIILLDVAMGFRLSIKLDLDLNYAAEDADNNLIAIELFLIDRNHNKIEATPQLGLYYQQRAAYVNLGNLLPNYYRSKSVRIDTNLDALISKLVTLLTGEIDKALGTDFDQAINGGNEPALSQNKVYNSSNMVALAVDEEGTATVKPGYAMLLDAITGLIGIRDYINTDNLADGVLNKYLEITFGNSMLLALEGLVGAIPFRLPNGISDIVLQVGDVVVPDVTDVDAYREYAETGKMTFGIQGAVNICGIDLSLSLRNFNIGFPIEGLDNYVTNAIGDKDGYTNSVAELLDDVLANMHLQFSVNMTFNKGTYDFIPLLTSFGLTGLEGQHLLWTFDDDFVLDGALVIQIALDKNNHYNSSIVIELRTNKAIGIGSDILFPANSIILGVYGYANSVFLDVSNIKIAKITLPKLKAEIDFTEIVYKFIGDFDYRLAFDLSTLFDSTEENTEGGASDPAQQAEELMFEGEEGGTLTPAGQIIVGVNADTLTVSTTLAAVLSLLSSLGVNVDLSFINSARIDLMFSRLQGVKLDLAAELVPTVEVDAAGNVIGEPTYNSDFKIHFETGTENNPIRIGNLDELKIKLFEKQAEFETYEDDLIAAIVDTVGKASFKATVNLKTMEETFNITKIINNILASSGKELALPINLHLDDWDTEVILTIAWNLDMRNFKKTQLQVTFSYLEKTLLEVDIFQGNIVLDLTGLGFFKLEIVNSPFVKVINSALTDVINKIGNFNLTDIINDALGDLTLGGALGGALAETTEENTPDSGVAEAEAGAGLTPETMDLIAKIISGVSAHNANIFLKFDAMMIDAILRQFIGFGIGISIGVGGEIDFVDGIINLNIEVESMSLSIRFEMLIGEPINLNLPLDEIPDWDATSGATFVKTMLDGLDVAFALDYALSTADIKYNGEANGDDAGVEDGDKYYTRLIIQKLQSNTTLYNTNGKTASAGSILITLASINKSKYENTDELNSNTNQQPLLYAELNYNTGNLRVMLCQNVLTLGSLVDFASFIDINIALDLVNMLAPTFDNLFASIGPDNKGVSTVGDTEGGGTTEPPKEPSRMDKAFAQLDVVQLLGGGIDVYLRNTGLFNANITFDPYTINWLIDEVMASIFGWDTIIDLVELTKDATTGTSMFSTNYLKSVNWDRIDGVHTWQSLKVILLPMIKEVVNGVGYGWASPLITNAILNSIYFQVRRLFTRLLPLPVFNEVTAGINIMDGTLANIYIFGYDYDEPVYKAFDENGNKIAKENQNEIYVYKNRSQATPDVNIPDKGEFTRKYDRSTDGNDDLGSSHANYANDRKNGYYLEIKLFNCSPSVGTLDYSVDGVTEGVMTWGSIDAAPTYDPYCYSNDVEGKSLFLAENFSGKEVSYQKGEQLYKTAPTYEVTKKNGVAVSMHINNLDFSTAGVYEIVATASFNGGAVVRTKTINLTIYGKDEITGVGEYNFNKEYQNYIDIYAYSEIPKYIVITYDNPDVLGNYMRRIPTESMTFTSYAPTSYTAHEVNGMVTFKNGTSKSVLFKYIDSTIDTIMGGREIAIDLYQYDQRAVDLSIYTPDVLYFTYNDGSSDKIKVNGAWNITSAEQLVNRDPSDLSAGIYWITNTIGSGASLQDVNIKFVVKSRAVDSVEVNGNLNNIRISPYQYYKYLITNDEKENPFPSQVLATYNEAYAYDERAGENVLVNEAYSEMVYVNWNKDGLNFTWNNNNAPEYNADGTLKKNGSVSLDTTSVKDPTVETPVRIYETSFDWTFPVNITMDRNEVQAIYFDEELTQNTLVIDPYLFKINKEDGVDNFPTNAWVKFTNGTVINLPIAWVQEEVDAFEVSYEVQSRQFRVYIGYDVDTYTNNRIPKADATSALGIADYCTAKGISGKMLQRILVNARVEGLEAVGIDIAGSELNGGRYVIDPVKVKYLGEAPLPATVPVVYNDGSSSVLPVVWNYDFDISIYGGRDLTATATIRGTGISFDVACRILDRSTPEVVKDNISINPYNFTLDEGGKRVYSEFTETVDVKYFTSYKLKVTKVETAEVTIFDNLFIDEKLALEELYTTGDNTGLYTVETEYNYDTFELPVTWDITNINMSVTMDPNEDKTFAVKAKIIGATESFETLAINVTVEEKIFVGINNNSVYKYFISYDGSNLTEDEIATKKVTKQLNAFFEDGTTQKLDIVFDLSPVNFSVTNYNSDTGSFTGSAIICKAYIMQYAEIQQYIEIEVYVATEPTA